MTIEYERTDLLLRTIEKGVLNAGQAILVSPGSFIRPEVHVHALSDDEIELRVERPGDRRGEIEVFPLILFREEINRSRLTSSYLGGIRVSWKLSQT